MTTEPVPVKVNVPKMKIIEPFDALALNVTGVPILLGSLEKATFPLKVITFPETEPARGILRTSLRHGEFAGWFGI